MTDHTCWGYLQGLNSRLRAHLDSFLYSIRSSEAHFWDPYYKEFPAPADTIHKQRIYRQSQQEFAHLRSIKLKLHSKNTKILSGQF